MMLIKFLIVGLSISVGCNLILGWLCHEYYTEMKFLNECMHELTKRCIRIMVDHEISFDELRKGNDTHDIEIEPNVKRK